MKKHIVVLGATGSIGTQTLQVVAEHRDRFEIVAISGGKNSRLLLEQASAFQIPHIFTTNALCKEELAASDAEVHLGWGDLRDILRAYKVEMVIAAIGGAAGLEPTFIALEEGIDVGLANKETLVAAGELVEKICTASGAKLLPVDSEHSAIFQCLAKKDPIEKLIITASGGPFRTWEKNRLKQATLEDALRHPNWSMGKKITVDSSTLMNKGLEVIEAHHLFHVDYDAIEVVVHPESIVHSMVQFTDGSVLAQCGQADMRVPIQLALTWPERIQSSVPRVDFPTLGALHFEEPRWEDFPALRLAYTVGKLGGLHPATMNAANEIAVAAFLEKKILWNEIVSVVQDVLSSMTIPSVDTLEELLAFDEEVRIKTKACIVERVSS